MKRPTSGSIYKPKYRNKNGELVEASIWWLQYYRPNSPKPVRESSKTDSWDEANRILKRKNGEVVTGRYAGPTPERVRLAELFADVVDDYRMNKRKSLASAVSRVKNHLEPSLGHLRAAEFSTAHVKKYVVARREAKASDATINRELELVKRSLTLAARCDPPKVVRVIYVPMLPENNVRTGFLDDAGYLALRNELPEYLRAVFVVAYHVGNRLGELRGMLWTQVDFERGVIRLNPGTTKNMKGRCLPIYGEMRAMLDMQKSIRDAKFPKCAHVFFDEQGGPLGEFRATWTAACKRAKQEGLLFHDLRRSAVRNMRLAGLQENVAMEISGHRTRAVFDRYNIVSGRDLENAATLLEKRHTEAVGKATDKVTDKVGESARPLENAEGAKNPRNLLN